MSSMKDPTLKRKPPLESLFDILTRTRPVRRSRLTEKEKVSQMLCFCRHVYGDTPLSPGLPFFKEMAAPPSKKVFLQKASSLSEAAPSLEASSPKETSLPKEAMLPEGWKVVGAAEREELGLSAIQLRDGRSGFNSELYKHKLTGHYVYAFQGTNITEINDWLNNILQGGGFDADQYKLALENAILLTSQLDQESLEFTGHSLGGGLAAAAATVTGVKAVTFNAAGVHSNTLKKYDKTIEEAQRWVVNYYVPGELLTFLQVKTPMPDAIGIQKELPAPLLESNQVGKPAVEQNLIETVKQFKTYLADYTEEEKRIFAERFRRHLIPALQEAVESM